MLHAPNGDLEATTAIPCIREDCNAWHETLRESRDTTATQGGSLAAGVFLDSHGSGFYTRVALGGGMDVSAAGEVSYSNSFSGLALEFQAGYGRGSGSFTIGPNGKTGGGMSAGVSLTGYSGHIAVTWTTPTYTGYWQ